MKKISFIISLLFLISFTKVKCQAIKQIGFYGVNGITALSSKTNILLLGNGDIIDISDPSSPELSGIISLRGFSSSVITDGNYAYFGTGMETELAIADISNPAFPLRVGNFFIPVSGGGIYGLTKNKNILFLALGNDGVYSLDISDKANPVVLDSIIIPDGQARDIISYANYAYVAHYDGLKILDISDPANLSVVATIGSGYNSIDIDTTNNLIFLGKNSGGVDVFNISNPSVPTPAFAISNTGGWAWDLKCQNTLLYLATDISGLYIYKYGNTSATEKAHFPNSNNGQSFAVSLQDSLILLSGLIYGVWILKYDSLGIVGINDVTKSEQVTLFPNPAKNYFEFDLHNENICEIEILNENGELILKCACYSARNRIDISTLPIGNYFVNFKNKSRSLLKKLIKVE